MLQGFLLGVVVTASSVIGAYFLKFWRQTRDDLFLAFGISFLIEAVNRASVLFLDSPHEGSAAIYVIRLLSYVLILAAIVNKNRR